MPFGNIKSSQQLLQIGFVSLEPKKFVYKRKRGVFCKLKIAVPDSRFTANDGLLSQNYSIIAKGAIADFAIKHLRYGDLIMVITERMGSPLKKKPTVCPKCNVPVGSEHKAEFVFYANEIIGPLMTRAMWENLTIEKQHAMRRAFDVARLGISGGEFFKAPFRDVYGE